MYSVCIRVNILYIYIYISIAYIFCHILRYLYRCPIYPPVNIQHAMENPTLFVYFCFLKKEVIYPSR
jgi:hypothetical protein